MEELSQKDLDAIVGLFELLAEIEQTVAYNESKQVEKGSSSDENISPRKSVE